MPHIQNNSEEFKQVSQSAERLLDALGIPPTEAFSLTEQLVQDFGEAKDLNLTLVGISYGSAVIEADRISAGLLRFDKLDLESVLAEATQGLATPVTRIQVRVSKESPT